MKRFYLFSLAGLVLSGLIFLPPAFSQTNETLTISTYYPSPYGVYKELRLYPNTSPTDCTDLTEGNMYYNSTLKQVMVCKWTGDFPLYDWRTIDSLWTLNATNLYPNNTTWNVGIGTTGPSTRLHIAGPASGAIRIEDGNQAAGRVLTSDASGVGTWQAPGGGGGGAGGVAMGFVTVSPGQSIPVTVGAGGGNGCGGDGGNSIFSTLTGSGGKGGDSNSGNWNKGGVGGGGSGGYGGSGGVIIWY